jgi:thioredoxin reductase (NADPH)
MEKVEDIIIIGGGPAGYTAAIYAAREDFKTLVISGALRGGQLMLTTLVENYPGFPEGIQGPELMDLFRKQAENFGAKFIDDDVSEVDFSKKPFKVVVDSKTHYANSIIIALGASANWLGLESEKKLIGKGVSSCATCDGAFFKKKNVLVVGGGDTAMGDALFLTRFADSVTIVHRRDKFRASKIMQERVKSNPKIKIMLDCVVEEVIGKEKVTGVKVKNLLINDTTVLDIDGIFVAIGHSPNTACLKDKIKLDDHGYVVTKDEVKTNVEGVFAAGDVSDKVYRQAITAAGSGSKAAIEARDYLQHIIIKKE